MGVETTTDTLEITAPWTTNPVVNDLYTFGLEDKEIKDFRVVTIERDEDGRCKIVGLEYRVELYDPAATVPDFETTLSKVR